MLGQCDSQSGRQRLHCRFTVSYLMCNKQHSALSKRAGAHPSTLEDVSHAYDFEIVVRAGAGQGYARHMACRQQIRIKWND